MLDDVARRVKPRPDGWPATITKLRLDNQLNLPDAAYLIGVSPNTLNRYELGHMKIPVKKLDKILGVYNNLADSIKETAPMQSGQRSLADSPAKYRIAIQKQNHKYNELIGDCRFDDSGMDLTARLNKKRLQRDVQRRTL